MKHEYLPKKWKLKISDYLKENGKPGSELNTHDFELPLINIKFKGNLFAELERALVIDAPEFGQVMIFTEDDEYHIFAPDNISIETHNGDEKDFLIQKLQENNESLKQFVPIITLDLKSPLHTIKSFTCLLQRDSTELSEKQRKYLHYIIESCNSMEKSLFEYLDNVLNKYEKHEYMCMDLAEIVSEVKKGLIDEIEAAQMTIYVSDNLPKTTGQKAKLFLLFHNFIYSAILSKKADEKKPSVWIDSEYDEDGYVKISIRDNGIGIEEKYHREIFNVFTRGDDASEYVDNLKLAMCKKIVTEYGGEIWIESEKGIGTTFFFTLKLF